MYCLRWQDLGNAKIQPVVGMKILEPELQHCSRRLSIARPSPTASVKNLRTTRNLRSHRYLVLCMGRPVETRSDRGMCSKLVESVLLVELAAWKSRIARIDTLLLHIGDVVAYQVALAQSRCTVSRMCLMCCFEFSYLCQGSKRRSSWPIGPAHSSGVGGFSCSRAWVAIRPSCSPSLPVCFVCFVSCLH